MKLLVVSFALVAVASCQTAMPSFSWEDDRQQHIPLLRITFPDGGQDDFALLSPFNVIPQGRNEKLEDIDHCIYHGYLKNEAGVYVTVTGCPNTYNFQVQLHSSRMSDSMFNVVNGRVESVGSIFGSRVFSRSGNVSMVTDGIVEVPQKTQPDSMNPSAAVTIPANGYILRIKVRVDENFVALHGKDYANVARQIMAQAQNMWKLKDSLGTTVTFAVDSNVEAIPGKYVAGSDIVKVSGFNSKSDIDANVYLAYRQNQGGVVGLAYTPAVCGPAAQRTAIIEFFKDIMTTGQAVAHELGHNMGMNHDFENGDPNKPKADTKKKTCTKIGGIMDYYGKMEKWSSCSVEDMNAYIAKVQPFCLRAA